MGLPKETPEERLVELATMHVDNLLQQQTAPEDTAAIFLEPVIGEGGYVPAPAAYVAHLRALCDRHGILLVVDEIQTGFYRTGKGFAIEHSGITPDIMVFAKGFANGMPISGIVTTQEIMGVMPPGSLVSRTRPASVTDNAGRNILRQRRRVCSRSRNHTLHAHTRCGRQRECPLGADSQATSGDSAGCNQWGLDHRRNPRQRRAYNHTPLY
jgi:4-aminobutyrate aminotransferase-like enzyme